MLTKKQNYEKIRTLNTGTDQAGMEIEPVKSDF
jgi:hypothetical protein